MIPPPPSGPRYARPGPEAIARHLAATGPAARRAPAGSVTRGRQTFAVTVIGGQPI